MTKTAQPNYKGIILAGGSGTRLYPVTHGTAKSLLPVYDKPMVYYPLSTLMLAGIRDILLISTPEDLPRFQHLLGDGSRYGVHFQYAPQPKPEGIAQAFVIGKEFIGSSGCALVLGDNIFYGHDLVKELRAATLQGKGARVFAYPVNDPERYGVVEFDPHGKALSIELEITDVNRVYLERNQLNVCVMGRGTAWLDTGTHEALMEASLFIQTLQKRQGLMVACPEEIAYRSGYITAAQLEALAQPMRNNGYGAYLLQLLRERVF